MIDEAHKIGLLLQSSVPKERQQGIVLAVRGGHSKLFQKITEMAGADPDPETRYLARKGLEKLSQESVEEKAAEESDYANLDLEKLLNSSDPHARFAGLKKILEDKNKVGRFMLLSALSQETVPQLKASMVIGLGQFKNPEDVGSLAQFLRHEDSRIRANTVEALAMIGSEDAFRCIVAIMGDEDNRVKANVVKALQAIGGTSLFNLLKSMAQDERPWMRSSAAFAFSRIRSPQSLVMLARIAHNEVEQSIRDKARSFIESEKAAGNPAASVILEKLDKASVVSQQQVKKEVIQEAEFEAESEDELTTLLASSEPTRRYIALARIADGEFFKFADAFMEAFNKEQDPFLVSMMLTTVRIKKFAPAFARARFFVGHRDDRVRANAVEALAAIDAVNAIEILLPALKDTNSRVVGNAIMGLKNTGRIDLVIELNNMLKQGREAFKHSALYVISKVREPVLIGLIERLLSDHSPRVRDKAYSILQLYGNDRVSGSLRLQQEMDKRIELEKSRETFFENSLDKAFASVVRLVKSADQIENENLEKAKKNPEAEKLALLQLAEKCLQHNCLDQRTLDSVKIMDEELVSINALITATDSEEASSAEALEDAAQKMSELQLLKIEQRSLIARREALMTFFAFEFFSSRKQLDAQVSALMRHELGRVEGSLCSFVPEKRFSMLPDDYAPVSEIFDITMRLYQKHVWAFSFRTVMQFLRWAGWLVIFSFGFGVFITAFPPAAIGFAVIFLPYLIYKSLGLLVEWKIHMALMVDDYIHGRELDKELLFEKAEGLYSKVFSYSVKKHLLLGLWIIIALMLGGTIASAGQISKEFNLLTSMANLIAVLLALFVFASAYFKYLLIEPFAVFMPTKDPFEIADKVYQKDKVLIGTLFIFATFIITLVTATSVEVLTFLMPVLPADISAKLLQGLATISDLCLSPIVFSNIAIFVLMRMRKLKAV